MAATAENNARQLIRKYTAIGNGGQSGLGAVFILSLDCEGKWGMADSLTDHHRRHWTTDSLTKVYKDILDLLATVHLSATFAFVGALTLSPEQYSANRDKFGDSPAARAWLKYFEQDMSSGNYEGWFAPRLLSMVMERGRHEIASHGFSHLPLLDPGTTAKDATRELQAAVAVTRLHGVTPRTFIYPRHLIGHVNALVEHGFIAYRGGHHEQPGTAQRLANLASEFNVFAAAEPHSALGMTPVVVPSGYFINWQHGIRSRVPISVTVARWKAIVDDAIKHQRVAHAWFHPHNLIDGVDQLPLLEELLANVAKEVKAGDLGNLTQFEYARLISNQWVPLRNRDVELSVAMQ